MTTPPIWETPHGDITIDETRYEIEGDPETGATIRQIRTPDRGQPKYRPVVDERGITRMVKVRH